MTPDLREHPWPGSRIPYSEAVLFQKRNFDEFEAAQWHSRGVGPMNAVHYRKAGITPSEAERWMAAGIVSGAEARFYCEAEIPVDDAAAWTDLGISFNEIRELHSRGFNLDEASEWTRQGITAIQAEQYRAADLSPTDAAKWLPIEQNPGADARGFVEAGFSLDEASEWTGLGITAIQAEQYRAADLSPTDAAKWLPIEQNPGADARGFVEAGFSLGEAVEWVTALRLEKAGLPADQLHPMIATGFTIDEAVLLIEGSVGIDTAITLRSLGYSPKESVHVFKMKKSAPWPSRSTISSYEAKGITLGEAFKWFSKGISPLVAARFADRSVSVRYAADCIALKIRPASLDAWPQGWGIRNKLDWLRRGGNRTLARRFETAGWRAQDVISATEHLPGLSGINPARNGALLARLLPSDLEALVAASAPKLSTRAQLWAGKHFVDGRLELWQVRKQRSEWLIERFARPVGSPEWTRIQHVVDGGSLVDIVRGNEGLGELTSRAITRYVLGNHGVAPEDLVEAFSMSWPPGDEPIWADKRIMDEWEAELAEEIDEWESELEDNESGYVTWHRCCASIDGYLIVGLVASIDGHEEVLTVLRRENEIFPSEPIAESSWFNENGPVTFNGGNTIERVGPHILRLQQWGELGKYSAWQPMPRTDDELAHILVEWIESIEMEIIFALSSAQLDPRQTLSVKDKKVWEDLLDRSDNYCLIYVSHDVHEKVRQQLAPSWQYQFVAKALASPRSKDGRRLLDLLRRLATDGVGALASEY